MVLSVNLKREFIPKWNGNDKASVSEQIKIVHRPATVSMKERLFPREFSYGLNGEVKGVFTVDRKKIIKEFTIDLVNIAYQVEGEKTFARLKLWMNFSMLLLNLILLLMKSMGTIKTF